MKKILVSQRIIVDKKTKTIRDSLDHELIKFLIKNNFFIIPIPNFFPSKKHENNFLNFYFKRMKIKGVILSGGNDIGEFKLRDQLEKKVLRNCKINKTPVLGICRGMQLMSVFEKVKLRRIKNHVRTRNKLFNIEKKYERNVNSYHNWTIQNCPKDYKILYFAEDNSIEAIVHKKLKWEGWMWHPEREKKYHKKDLKRLRRLFD